MASLVRGVLWRRGMDIAKITWPGLAVIALLVAVLWGCIVAENSLRRSAWQSRRASFDALRVLEERRGGAERWIDRPARGAARGNNPMGSHAIITTGC